MAAAEKSSSRLFAAALCLAAQCAVASVCSSYTFVAKGYVVAKLIVKFFQGEFNPQGFKHYSGLWKGPLPGTIGKQDIAEGVANLKEQMKNPLFETNGGVDYGADESQKVADGGKGWVWRAAEMSPRRARCGALQVRTSGRACPDRRKDRVRGRAVREGQLGCRIGSLRKKSGRTADQAALGCVGPPAAAEGEVQEGPHRADLSCTFLSDCVKYSLLPKRAAGCISVFELSSVKLTCSLLSKRAATVG